MPEAYETKEQVRRRFRKSERKSDLLANTGITGETVGLSTC